VKEATIINTTVRKSHPKNALTAFQKMFHAVMLGTSRVLETVLVAA
jgi:hypothetical protein